MNDKIEQLVSQIQGLQSELRTALQDQETRVLFDLQGKRVKFEKAVRETHKRLKVGLFKWLRQSRPLHVLSAPFIYSLIFPMLFLEISLFFYQLVCFRIYRIAAVKRSDYFVIDRHHLAYLNIIEKINCFYCSYVNGLIAYTRELGSKTEQYWCPIKHASNVVDVHERYASFIDYGDADNYHSKQQKLQFALNDVDDSNADS